MPAHEKQRLQEIRGDKGEWQAWGPYLSARLGNGARGLQRGRLRLELPDLKK